MFLNILVTDEMLPLPTNIMCEQEYGIESVVAGRGLTTITSGTAMRISADEASIITWLKPFDGIWISNSPSTGQWEIVHIRDDV